MFPGLDAWTSLALQWISVRVSVLVNVSSILHLGKPLILDAESGFGNERLLFMIVYLFTGIYSFL